MWDMLLFLLLACASAPRGLPATLIEQFKWRHTAVYDVYQLGLDKDQIHDHLAKTYLGDALTEAYILHFQTMVKMKEDETAIDVRQVDYSMVDFEARSINGVLLNVDWSVGGIVTHQKHKHTRVNRYQAGYTLQADADGEWKIVHTRVHNAERIQRAFLSDDAFFEGEASGGAYLDPLDLLEGGLLEDAP